VLAFIRDPGKASTCSPGAGSAEFRFAFTFKGVNGDTAFEPGTCVLPEKTPLPVSLPSSGETHGMGRAGGGAEALTNKLVPFRRGAGPQPAETRPRTWRACVLRVTGFPSAWRPPAAVRLKCCSSTSALVMEPQKEARTLQDAVVRPPGASRSPAPEEEERREGSASPASTGEKADSAGADGLWELPVEPAERRPECSRCRWERAGRAWVAAPPAGKAGSGQRGWGRRGLQRPLWARRALGGGESGGAGNLSELPGTSPGKQPFMQVHGYLTRLPARRWARRGWAEVRWDLWGAITVVLAVHSHVTVKMHRMIGVQRQAWWLYSS
jgi:hypothetical protein